MDTPFVIDLFHDPLPQSFAPASSENVSARTLDELIFLDGETD